MKRLIAYSVLTSIVLSLSCGTEPPTDPGENPQPWDGGVFPLAGGAVEVAVPAGAHATAITVTATPVSSPLPSSRLVAGSAYDIGPDGTQFLLPVSLTLSYDGLTMPQGVIATELRIHKLVDDAWREIPGSSVDTTAKNVTAQLTSLSRYGLLGLPVASVTVEPSDTLVAEHQDVQLTARLFDITGSELGPRIVEWSSNDTLVAAVDSLGLVTGISVGSATITAAVDGVSDSASVTVEQVAATVEITPEAATMSFVGETVQLTATASDASGHVISDPTFTWESSDENIATVSDSGLVTAVADGTATVAATVDGVSGYSVVAVVVPVATVTVAPATASITVGTTVQLTATLLDASGNTLLGRTVTWTTNNAAVAGVDSTGHVWGVSVGSATITASAGGVTGTSIISVSEGTTWTAIGPSTAWNAGVYGLAFDPNVPSTMYASLHGFGVFKSTDSGDAWTAANTGLPARLYVTRIISDPSSSSNLVVGTAGDGLFRSTDASNSWAPANAGIALSGDAEWPYWTVFSLAIDRADPSTLYAGFGGGGLYKTENGGDSWTAMAGIAANAWIYALAIDPQNPAIVYAGGYACGGFGLMRSVDGGASWTSVGRGLTEPAVWAIAIDPVNTANVYVTTHTKGVFKSTNGGANFSPINNGISAGDTLGQILLQPIAIDPIMPATLYVAGGARVYRSTNGGQFWLDVSTGLPAVQLGGAEGVLTVAPTDHQKVFVGYPTGSGGIFVRSFPEMVTPIPPLGARHPAARR